MARFTSAFLLVVTQYFVLRPLSALRVSAISFLRLRSIAGKYGRRSSLAYLRRPSHFIVMCSLLLACTPLSTIRAADFGQSGSETITTAQQFGQVFRVSIGTTIVVHRPINVDEWQADVATDILNLLSQSNKRKSAGPEGERFIAIGPGETDVALTEQPARGGGAPPAPRRFVVTVRVLERSTR